MVRRSRVQSLGEEIANAVSHGVGALASLIFLVLLLLQSTTVAEVAAALLFSLSAFFLFLMSTLYHAFPQNTIVKRVFKRFDHISIYLLIGGSFSPLFLIVMEQPIGWILCLVQYAVIAVGIVFKAVFVHRLEALHIAAYLALGWSALFLLEPLGTLSMMALSLIVAGGLAYTIGVFFYSSRLFKFSHLVWHLFVMLGTALHFLAFLLYIY